MAIDLKKSLSSVNSFKERQQPVDTKKEIAELNEFFTAEIARLQDSNIKE